MDFERPTLGSLIRDYRKRQGWTVREFSEKSGIPFSTLSKVEQDRLNLTYDKLRDMSERLGIRMSELLSEPEDSVPVIANSRRSFGGLEDALHVSTPQYEYFYLASELNKKDMIPLISKVNAKSLSEFGDMVRHKGQEFIYVLEGRVEVHTEFYDPVTLDVGQWIYLDSQMGHAFTVGEGSSEAKILSICSTSQEELIRSAKSLADS